jgi:sn1-specific diacylglycerol lipase
MAMFLGLAGAAYSAYGSEWVSDYATVGGALKSNFSALGPFSAGDVTVGLVYLWDHEKSKRRESDPATCSKPQPGDLGPGPSPDVLDDFRVLCAMSQVAYWEDKDAVAKFMKRHGHEVIHHDNKTAFQEPAYIVSDCREKKEVMFIIRGTSGAADALTDGDCAPVPLDSALPEFQGATAHRGMKKAADWLLKEGLVKLKRAMDGIGSGARLTVTGHSLGAGSAAIVSILLREHFPKMRCVAFATPACLDLSACVAAGADVKNPFMTSVVLHDDVVPRASRQNVDDLRVRIQSIDWYSQATDDFNASKAGKAAAYTKVGVGAVVGKASSVAGYLGEKFAAATKEGTRGGSAKATAGSAASAAKSGAVAGAKATTSLAKSFGAKLGFGKKKSADGDTRAAGDEAPAGAADGERMFIAGDASKDDAPAPTFYVPGVVYHLRRGPTCAGGSVARVKPDCASLCAIQLSGSFINDHSLNEYVEALDALAIRKSPGKPKEEIRGKLEWQEAGETKYKVGMTNWKEHETFVLAHEFCLKKKNEDGELMPKKVDLYRGGYVLENEGDAGHDFKGKGPHGIKIVDPTKKKDPIRLYVPSGEKDLKKWIKTIRRCIEGDVEDPKCAPEPLYK